MYYTGYTMHCFTYNKKIKTHAYYGNNHHIIHIFFKFKNCTTSATTDLIHSIRPYFKCNFKSIGL